jgi:DNA-binding response OmpR family regulator
MTTVLLAGVRSSRLWYLRDCLRSKGFRVRQRGTTHSAGQLLPNGTIEAVVVDACASNSAFDPWRLCRHLFEHFDLPMVVLTRSNRVQDRLRAFREGADRCLTIPVSPEELEVCLDGLLRRRRADSLREGTAVTAHYADDQLEIDLRNYRIHRNGGSLSLTPREYPLLLRLLQNLGVLTTSEELCEAAWGPRTWPQKRDLLKIYIWQLRQKVEPDAKHPQYILSQRGLGYVFLPKDGDGSKPAPVPRLGSASFRPKRRLRGERPGRVSIGSLKRR